MVAPRIHLDELAEFSIASPLELDDTGRPRTPLVFVELSGRNHRLDTHEISAIASRGTTIFVGVAPDGLSEDLHDAADALDVSLVAGAANRRSVVSVADLDAATAALETAAATSPRALVTLGGLLRLTTLLPVRSGLAAESLAYSMLLSGPEFRRWRESRPAGDQSPSVEPAVLMQRDEDVLEIRINRPHRHNAFDRFVRDGLLDAFEVACTDDSIRVIRLAGNGPSFCSGGDLAEFGSCTDVVTAHLIRLDRSVAARVHDVRDRTHVLLHGACIGAGIEIPSFADHVHARADAFFQLPEIAMGLVPGAGGTVGITRRIGRWRTAYLAFTGERVGAGLALEWGLIDAIADD